MRIHPRKTREAYVTIPGRKDDLVIDGIENRNRALDGDLVAVEVIGQRPWKSSLEGPEIPPETITAPVLTDSEDGWATDNSNETAVVAGLVKQVGKVILPEEEDDEVESYHPGVEVPADDEKRLRDICKVVAIKERVNTVWIGRFAPAKENKVGDVALSSSVGRSPRRMAFFQPTDKRIPHVYIDTRIHPLPDGTDNANNLFAVRLDRWPVSSRLPFGIVMECFGEMGNIHVETAALLAQHQVRIADFAEAAYACLPKTPWSISAQDVSKRLDLREKRIFTIDPETTRDVDDALSCERLPGGGYRIGVHIADVSHFVLPNTPLDEEAKMRSTSVYLVQKCLSMLPRLLCEELCSLNPNVDRLAFSVMWTLDDNANIKDEWFGKTVIRSCCKFAYSDAQSIIEVKSNCPYVTGWELY